MKSLLALTLSLASFSVMAETLVSKIHSYKESDGFIRLENGRVAFLNTTLKSLHDFTPGSNVKVELDEQSSLTSVEFMENDPKRINLKSLQIEEDRPAFTPTILPSLKAANEMFDRLQPDYKRVSECTDRAHVWSYDEFKKNGVMSQKVFAFFTASYINRNKYKWWFHVAPLVQVQEGAVVESRVMDFRYTDSPKLIKEWTDLLVFSKRTCKMTTKFSEYDVNPQTEDCYMMIDTMYNRIPADLKAQEDTSTYRTSFNDSEVKFSRKMAFETIRSN
ncbi:MAG TPA: protein-glutamine glutaminase family protein [Bacteriovoracaceae bacterium]|nr:protein-glutamine glutaminase family protein [Bacteriovoracaceae bacterium]